MRLHPSVGMTLPRQVPTGDAVIAGEWSPEGTRVGVNATVKQRDGSISGIMQTSLCQSDDSHPMLRRWSNICFRYDRGPLKFHYRHKR